jgi:manganese/iron transport system permease protein/iron/zinc/copper transport system permease protein
MNYLLFGLLILALVTSHQADGSVLSVGLLVAPAATLSLLTNRTAVLFWGSGLLGAAGSVGALLLAYWTDLAAGPAIVIVLGGLFLLAFLVSPKYGLLPNLRSSSS